MASTEVLKLIKVGTVVLCSDYQDCWYPYEALVVAVSMDRMYFQIAYPNWFFGTTTKWVKRCVIDDIVKV